MLTNVLGLIFYRWATHGDRVGCKSQVKSVEVQL